MGTSGNDAQALFAHIGQRRVIGHIVREPLAAMEPETDGCLIFKFIFASDLPQEEQIRGPIVLICLSERLLGCLFQEDHGFNGIPFVPQKLRNFPAILEHRKIQTNPL